MRLGCDTGEIGELCRSALSLAFGERADDSAQQIGDAVIRLWEFDRRLRSGRGILPVALGRDSRVG
jgi:hypothetical protein